jgi:hypothetical protein
MSAIFISASPGVTASALSWLIGEGVSEWGGSLGGPHIPRKARGRGQGLPESHGPLPLQAGPSLWPLPLAAGARFDGGPVC